MPLNFMTLRLRAVAIGWCGVCLVVLALTGFNAAARAADAAQTPLTAGIIEEFLTSHDELEGLAKGFASRYGDRAENIGDDPVDALPAYQDIPEARDATTAVLARHRFSNIDEWQSVMNSVLLAYQFLDPANVAPDIDADQQRARADIESDKGLSAEARAQALAQIDAQYAAMDASAPLPGNVEAVRPFAQRITPLLDHD